jgi:hypothetical protein
VQKEESIEERINRIRRKNGPPQPSSEDGNRSKNLQSRLNQITMGTAFGTQSSKQLA